MRMIFKVSYYVRSNYENKQGKSPLENIKSLDPLL